MVPPRFEGVRQTRKESGATMLDSRTLAVTRCGRALDHGAVEDGNRLVPETHAQKRDAGVLCRGNHLDRPAGVLRTPRTRRNDDGARTPRKDLGGIEAGGARHGDVGVAFPRTLYGG